MLPLNKACPSSCPKVLKVESDHCLSEFFMAACAFA
jgi:hypothetical protein